MSVKRSVVTAIILTFCAVAFAQESNSSKYEPALDVTSMDRSADPCADFFQYSCGGWIKNNPIPPDQSSWDTYSKMQDENRVRLRTILDAAAAPDASRNAVTQKIGDYYASCTDEKAIEDKGGAAQAHARPHRRDPLEGRAGRHCRRHDRGRRSLRLRIDPGFSRRQPNHRGRGSGRVGPARSRLLHQGRCEVGGAAQAISGPRAKNV